MSYILSNHVRQCQAGDCPRRRFFPEDRAPETDDGQVVRIRMDRLTVRDVRNWGEVWLGLELWDKLGLDGFWREVSDTLRHFCGADEPQTDADSLR